MNTTFLADSNTSELAISQYQPGLLALGQDQSIAHSIIASTEGHLQAWRPQSISELSTEDLQTLIDRAPPLLIFGTGSQQHLLSRPLKQQMDAAGIPYEVMSSASACKTFNMMLIDQRPATLALLIR